ncbi:copper-binding protein [Roseateles chitinivorans]|uniref:copper-binding protein n=1 Tax=Roseateles chitinivorans TaxID=2917965 RepID=UPI003D667134
MKTTLILSAVLALGTATIARAQGMSMPMKPASSPSEAALPLVDAEVRKVDLSKGLVVLRHGDIPNLAMPGMTMGFDVADKKMLDGLKVGDKVKFQVEMVKGKATVTELKPAR